MGLLSGILGGQTRRTKTSAKARLKKTLKTAIAKADAAEVKQLTEAVRSGKVSAAKAKDILQKIG